MAEWLRDTIDFSAYLSATDASVNVRKASAFRDELLAKHERVNGPKLPHMFSTRLRDCIEFRPGEVTAWAGYSGHRKSMFTGQVALDLCTQNQRTLMVSLEMAPEETLFRMSRQASGTARMDKYQVDAFSEWTNGRLWLLDYMGRLQPDKAIAICRYFATELKGKHVFVDSMMKVCQSEESYDEQKQLVSDLCDLAKETGIHAHLITHCRKPQGQDDSKPPSKYDVRGTSATTDQCHNVITVWLNKPKLKAIQADPNDQAARQQPDIRIAVEKQRNGEYEGSVGLWFHSPSMRFMDDRVSLVQEYDFMKQREAA